MGKPEIDSELGTESNTETMAPRRRQFGIKHLLLLTCVVAASIVAWQKFFYVHPAHKNPLYEKAPYSRSGAIKLGPTRVSIKSVSRTDRNGSLLVENGFGKPLNATPLNAQVLKDSGAWLDSAQIELDGIGGTFDVIDVRVFDFETRQRIDKVVGASGYRMPDLKTLQIFRLGEKLPDVVDVFFRLQVFKPDNVPTKLIPKAGATCALHGGTVEVVEVVRGYQGYAQSTGFVSDPDVQSRTGVMLRPNGTWPQEAKYLVTAVKTDGTRVSRDRYFHFPGSYVDSAGRRFELVVLDAELDDIQHLEMRPFDGQHRFFFEGVQLPRTSAVKFANPPSPTVQLNGVEETVAVPELAPLDVSVRVLKGTAISGLGGNGREPDVSLFKTPKDVERKISIVERLDGLSTENSSLIVTPGKASPHGGVYGDGSFIRMHLVDVPIEDVKSVKIQLPKP